MPLPIRLQVDRVIFRSIPRAMIALIASGIISSTGGIIPRRIAVTKTARSQDDSCPIGAGRHNDTRMQHGHDIGIIGAGAWGTALALVCARAGGPGTSDRGRVLLQAHDPGLAESIQSRRCNDRHLPGQTLPNRIEAIHDISQMAGCRLILIACPAQRLRTACLALRPYLGPVPVVLCAKGVEDKTGLFMHEVARQVLGDKATLIALSGPNFAADIAAGRPAAASVACVDIDVALNVATMLRTDDFRPYAHNDIIGCSVAGALKNVIAIGCGIVAGKNMGENAVAALMTRGYAEMVRLAVACGANGTTMAGLAGIGDLCLTCSSRTSRNTLFGWHLGQGCTPSVAKERINSVVEGVISTKSIGFRAKKLGIDMPICATVEKILWHEANIDAMIRELLMRPLREEFPPRQ